MYFSFSPWYSSHLSTPRVSTLLASEDKPLILLELELASLSAINFNIASCCVCCAAISCPIISITWLTSCTGCCVVVCVFGCVDQLPLFAAVGCVGPLPSA